MRALPSPRLPASRPPAHRLPPARAPTHRAPCMPSRTHPPSQRDHLRGQEDNSAGLDPPQRQQRRAGAPACVPPRPRLSSSLARLRTTLAPRPWPLGPGLTSHHARVKSGRRQRCDPYPNRARGSSCLAATRTTLRSRCYVRTLRSPTLSLHMFPALFIGESGLLENEPTAPAEQAHTTRRQ